MLDQIDLVSDERNDDVRIGLLLQFLDPVLRLLEGIRACDIVDNDGGCEQSK